MALTPAVRVLPSMLVLLAACAPWRSDIELPPGVAAAPVLAVQGFRRSSAMSSERRVAFGPWTAERRPAPEDGWYLRVLHDTAVVGWAWCADIGPGNPRRKGTWRTVPLETFVCDLALAGDPDTLHLEVKSDARHPFAGTVENTAWSIAVHGTDRLRTRQCLYMPTCGWYLTLDGLDIAAVEADANAWVYLSPDLGVEVRAMAATIAAALVLRADPARGPGSQQRPMIAEP